MTESPTVAKELGYTWRGQDTCIQTAEYKTVKSEGSCETNWVKCNSYTCVKGDNCPLEYFRI